MSEEKREKLRQAQLRDVAEMQAIREAAAVTGDANEACRQVMGGPYSLSKDVAEGIEKREGSLGTCNGYCW